MPIDNDLHAREELGVAEVGEIVAGVQVCEGDGCI